MKNYFESIVSLVNKTIKSDERFTLSFSAETLDYARFNHALIRQAGVVEQQYIELDLIQGQKQASCTIGLSQDLERDQTKIDATIKKLREQITVSADDPFLMISESNNSSEHIVASTLQDKHWIVETILREAEGLDLVGSYCGGPIYKGFANSYGQTNWFQKSSFVLDASVFHSGDKAIKQSYSDIAFDAEVFERKIDDARAGLSLFEKPSLTLSPGSYRAYFAPRAVDEILSMINWGGFSRKSLAVKSSPLMPLHLGTKRLAPTFSLAENIQAGVGPNFQPQGFVKPPHTAIIENGTLRNTLISPKTAKEYGLEHNGADESESMCSIDMASGNLSSQDILSALDDGLYINNLWYINFSDRQNGCLTGMTRFFCYIVKNGKPVAPFSVMRFDESIYRLFGENLRHITKEREMIIDNSTYDERSTSCSILPGIIAENVRFTL